MTYQLVLQFPGSAPTDFDTMIDIEDSLIARLDGSADVDSHDADVDGHDIGSGEFNIFIRTESPSATFAIVKCMPSIQPFLDRLRAAYRNEESEIFTPVYPPELDHFSVA